jgi:hypothetical protein
LQNKTAEELDEGAEIKLCRPDEMLKEQLPKDSTIASQRGTRVPSKNGSSDGGGLVSATMPKQRLVTALPD